MTATPFWVRFPPLSYRFYFCCCCAFHLSSASNTFLGCRALLGECSRTEEDFKEWVANERFEGDLELTSSMGKKMGAIVFTAHRKPIGNVVKTSVSVTSLCVHVKSVKAAHGVTFSPMTQYAVKITLGGSEDKTLLAKPFEAEDEAVVQYDEFLCVSFTSDDVMQAPLKFKIELLERKERSLQNYFQSIAETLQCADKDFEGLLDLHCIYDMDVKHVCTIDLSVSLTKETAKYLKELPNPTSQGKINLPSVPSSEVNAFAYFPL